MALQSTGTADIWKANLPHSKIIYPQTFSNRMKYLFWRLYTPLHASLRDACLSLNLLQHSGRQNFLIGHIGPNQSIESIVTYLIQQGYANHFVAWIDEDEAVGLRYIQNFEYQYHIRIFKDGEVRGHYEYTPECYPFKHFRAVNQQDERDYFKSLFGDKLVYTQTA